MISRPPTIIQVLTNRLSMQCHNVVWCMHSLMLNSMRALTTRHVTHADSLTTKTRENTNKAHLQLPRILLVQATLAMYEVAWQSLGLNHLLPGEVRKDSF